MYNEEFERRLSKGLRTLFGVCTNLQVTAPLGIRRLTGQNSHDSIRRIIHSRRSNRRLINKKLLDKTWIRTVLPNRHLLFF